MAVGNHRMRRNLVTFLKFGLLAAIVLLAASLVSRLFGGLWPTVWRGPGSLGLHIHQLQLQANQGMANQGLIDYIAKHLDIRYEVLTNLETERLYKIKWTVRNTGNSDIPVNNWVMYFCHFTLVENTRVPEGTIIGNNVARVTHINGCLHKFEPRQGFGTLKSGKQMVIIFNSERFMIARTDAMPNWYVTASNCKPRTLKCTEGESLNFVGHFDQPAKWKRGHTDQYDPYTPAVRFSENEVKDLGRTGSRVLPTPKQMKIDESKSFTINRDTWVIVAERVVQNEATFLKGKLGLIVTTQRPAQRFILLQLEKASHESYSLTANPDMVIITGSSTAGLFYGIQTLLSLLGQSNTLPSVEISDYPRYKYRGLMLDVVRNFHSKKEVMRLMDIMAMYKMNKLHLHLTDDEGWRVEIPGLPELTQVGGKRLHDTDEHKGLLPAFGSGPTHLTSGSGYYSTSEYKEILKHANTLHIEVIPEVDMPGHGRAAMKSMEARRHKLLKQGKPAMADQYLLTDFDDKSKYLTPQHYKDDAICPCLESTYTFVEHVIKAFIDLHKDIQPLRTFHFGGDEVAANASTMSPVCQQFIAKHPDLVKNIYDTKRYFVTRVAKIAAKYHLNVAGWEDAFFQRGEKTAGIDRGEFPNKEVTANAWLNIWEWGLAHRAYKLANDGFKIVLSHATHLYFDHPHEPDPEERGLYWATRFIDIRKTFGYMPENLYELIDVNRLGEPINREEACEPKNKYNMQCTHLQKPENILGIQGHVWTETIRTPEQMDAMIFPRMLALAERAWHKAAWEMETKRHTRDRLKNEDWAIFANTVGYQELPRLDKMGVHYYIPPPGAKISQGKLQTNTALPGLKVVFSTDGGQTWKLVDPAKTMQPGTVLLATWSTDGKRSSRLIPVKIPN